MIVNKRYLPRESSWLSFNERVLQEASNPENPLMERIKFLGIFSNNLDEFFRVRVATLKRLTLLSEKKTEKFMGHAPIAILRHVRSIILSQSKQFEKAYESILKLLEKEDVEILDEHHLTQEQKDEVEQYFHRTVRPRLAPIMLNQLKTFPVLRDDLVYLAVSIEDRSAKKTLYSIIEIPQDLPRFYVLQSKRGEKKYILYIDDIIRLGLKQIYSLFSPQVCKAYTIKLTRDAELDIDDDFSESYINQIHESLQKRRKGLPVRFVYDKAIPESFLKFLTKGFKVDRNSDTVIAGMRYHNFKDLMKFPKVFKRHAYASRRDPISHPILQGHQCLFDILDRQDVLLHFPYHSFNYVLDLLREAAIDPEVVRIKLTVYRLAKHSAVMNALVNAARNGKKVTVVMELTARFDEEANIYWSNRLKEENINVIFGVKGLKVHSKLCQITRKKKSKEVNYVMVGTGNFNEDTATIYTDHMLMSTDRRIASEVRHIFDFLENNYKQKVYRHLIMSPFYTRRRFLKFIDDEIKLAKNGQEAYIHIKINNMADIEIIDKLYEASQAGVKIKIIARSMFSLIPGLKGVSENIEAKSIVDGFLEHTRFIIFGNQGDPRVYITSSDWMTRNFDRRVEASCPIYDKRIQRELIEYFNLQWKDNVRARHLDKRLSNKMVTPGEKEGKVRAQKEMYSFLSSLQASAE